MRLSQNHLTDYDYCPRLFQYHWIDQWGLEPEAPDQLDRLREGREFHQLVQQRSLRLPIEPFLLERAQWQQWWQAIEQAEPELFRSGSLQDSEHLRTLDWLGHTLVVVYDWLQMTDDRAVILDWKTYAKPRGIKPLQERWQSQLYPFVLQETSAYPAEQIELRYWFLSAEPQSVRLVYSDDRHRKVQQRLEKLLTQLTQGLTAYEQAQTSFSQTQNLDRCQTCRYQVWCGRGQSLAAGAPQQDWSWDAIEEIRKN